MAASNTMGRVHLHSRPYLYEERLCRGCLHRTKPGYNLISSLSSSLSTHHSTGSSARTSGYGKLACKCSRSSNILVVSFENMPGRVDTPVDAGIKVSNVEFIPDILDIRYRENNRAAPPVVPCYPPLDENGPNELDFEIYASNSMVNYEPPPPPRIPFSFPFEDYYGEAIGVDYISKEEKPANSLLQILDSLNAKNVKEGGENKSFSSGSLHTAETAKEKPLHPESAGQQSGQGRNDDLETQAIVSGSGPINVTNLVQTNAEDKVSFYSNTAMEKLLEQPRVSSQPTMPEMTLADDRNLRIEKSLHSLSPTVMSINESQNTGRSTSFRAIPQEQCKESSSSEDMTLPNRAGEEAQVTDSCQSGMHAKSGSSVPVPPWAESPDGIAIAHTHIQQQIKGNLRQMGYDNTLIESTSKEDGIVSEMCVEQMHKVASADAGRECLTYAHSFKEALPMSQFYVPQEGDLIVGAVTFINDQKVDLEIGAELSAIMPLRDLQPLLQHASSGFFDTCSEDDLSVPFGESLLVKDEIAFSSFSCTGLVDVGTILVAEVIGKTIIDGRAILSCKSPAQKLAWHRIDQLMRLGEAVQIKIMQWNEGGLLGSFEGIRAFIPKSELVQKPESITLLKNYVGRTLSVAVVQTDRQTFNIIASEVKAWMSKNLQLGTVHDVTVTRVHSYGIQVEVDNTKIRGFVHKTNLSKEYVSSAANYFAEGDKAKVMLIKGRDPTKISFSLADLEKENGLLLRNKEQVFRDAEEMGRRFREHLPEQERRIYGVAASELSRDYQDPEIANLAWLHIGNA